MSYDMQIANKSFNYTYNVAAMWYYVMPDHGIRVIYGKTGQQALEPLLKIYTKMVEHHEFMVQLEPENGWGSFNGALTFVHELIIASTIHPAETWSGD